MKTTDEWMAETMQPIFDMMAGGPMTEDERREARERLAMRTGPQFSPLVTKFHTCKAADRLPPGCDGCREEIGGRLVCCINQTDEE